MTENDILREKIQKLFCILALTDPAFSNVEMNELSMRQIAEYSRWEMEHCLRTTVKGEK